MNSHCVPSRGKIAVDASKGFSLHPEDERR
jgi:hypothetical protein